MKLINKLAVFLHLTWFKLFSHPLVFSIIHQRCLLPALNEPWHWWLHRFFLIHAIIAHAFIIVIYAWVFKAVFLLACSPQGLLLERSSSLYIVIDHVLWSLETSLCWVVGWEASNSRSTRPSLGGQVGNVSLNVEILILKGQITSAWRLCCCITGVQHVHLILIDHCWCLIWT